MYCRFLHFNEFDPYNERLIVESINDDINKFNNYKAKSVLGSNINHQNVNTEMNKNKMIIDGNKNNVDPMNIKCNNKRTMKPNTNRSILGRRSFSNAFGSGNNNNMEIERFNGFNNGYNEPQCKRQRI